MCIEKRPFLAASDKIPDLPHLVVVPGTVLAQWEQEIKTLFRPASVDVLIYGTGVAQHTAFWSQSGAYHSSKHRPINRIIVASHSVGMFFIKPVLL